MSAASQSTSVQHTLSVLVQDTSGVLARIASLFSRRGFNITSLAVGPTQEAGTSRITVVVDVEDGPLEQVVKQLNKLVNVLKVVELEPTGSVSRELVLVKVRVDAGTRRDVVDTASLFRAKVVDVYPDSVVLEATGDAGKVEALLRVLEPYGVVELVQSGVVVLARGSRALGDRALRPAERSA